MRDNLTYFRPSLTKFFTMKKLVLVASVVLSSTFALNSQVVFFEDFDGVGGPTAGGAGTYSFPAGWTLFNVDNRTPAAAVSYVNDAWERREDFANNVADSCAFSTSWYTPAGAADDWMWTPAISSLPANCVLSWNALTYDPSYRDGYQVRIMVGTAPTLANQNTSATLFSIAAENTTWTNRTVNLNAYAGQTIYIGFRNNSNDKFLLLIDDVRIDVQVNNDMQLLSSNPVNSQYTIMPLSQVTPFDFSGTVRNNGILTQNNVTVNVSVFDGAMTSVYSASSTPIGSVAPGASAPFTIAGFTPSASDNYTIRYLVSAAVVDQIPANDTSYEYISVDDSIYARDDGNITGTLGIGSGTGGFLGQIFDLTSPDVLTSVSFYITNGAHQMDNQEIKVVIFSYNNGVPVSPIDTTVAYFCDTAVGQYITLPISGGPLSLPADTFYLGVLELDSNITLATTGAIFNASVTNVDFPVGTGLWNSNEDYGFNVVYVLRANLGDVCLNNTSSTSSTQASCISCADGTATVTPIGTDGTVTYSWSPAGGTAATATGLLTGTYYVTITDGFGCVTTDTVFVAYDICWLLSTTTNSTDASCGTCADGAAQVVATGGTGPLTYVWSNGGTSDTIQNVLPGTYYVTITDSLGCVRTDTVVVNFSTDIAGINSPGAIGIFPNPSNGAFQVNVNLATSSDITVFVTNTLGEVVVSKSVNGIQNGRIDMNVDLAAGTYNLHVRSVDTEKVIPITIQK